MAIILRADVDKPYGKHTILRKVASKVKEDYFPKMQFNSGYLSHLKEMLHLCNTSNIQGTFYHRICTVPDSETIELFRAGNHEWGLHLENSKSEKTFIQEWNEFRKYPGCSQTSSFSKHGSGVHKLGKYHYPFYEPEKYQKWAKKNDFHYPSGNGIASCKEDLFIDETGFFKSLFWFEPSYRDSSFAKIENLIEAAFESDVVALIHPCNFVADPIARKDFEFMIELATKYSISVKSFKGKIN
jgi:hypothetical protein